MTRTLVPNAIATPFALPLFAAPAAALPEDQAVFTDFEDVNLDAAQLNGIDDFDFTPLPEPGALLTLMSGAALLGAIGRGRYAR